MYLCHPNQNHAVYLNPASGFMLLQKKMIDKEISNLTAIDTLIRQEQPFAVYRIPGENGVFTWKTLSGEPYHTLAL